MQGNEGTKREEGEKTEEEKIEEGRGRGKKEVELGNVAWNVVHGRGGVLAGQWEAAATKREEKNGDGGQKKKKTRGRRGKKRIRERGKREGEEEGRGKTTREEGSLR